MLKKFQTSDVFINTIKTYPKVRIFTYSGSMYYSNSAVSDDGVKLFDFLMEPIAPPAIINPPWVEGFEYPDWSGTISNTLYYLTLTFDSPWVEDFETDWSDVFPDT